MSLLCKKSRTRILFEPPCSAFLYHTTSFFSVQSLFYVTSINSSAFRDTSVFSTDCKSISSVPFRGDDIVGRIGGDEFIILMRNVTTKEAVRTKAEQLMAETKKLVFDEMDGKGITISVGIALAPEHGKTYMNLYRSADQALYETKRNGRNGFTIYGENRDITENR